MEDEILATKRSMIKSMEESERAMIAIPAASTVVNVFPGDLRDWFAGQALAGLMSNGVTYKILAPEVAYQIADAMLAARGAKK